VREGGRRIVFMGSPGSAVPSLEAVAERFEVPLVLTQPDRPKGRGRKLRPTPVRWKAGELGLEVLQAADVNDPSSVEKIRAARPSAIVVVSFGQILRKPVLEAAPLGCTNLHFSLLPKLRGAAPVPWAIIRGCSETGVSVMRVTEGLDEGPVYAQEKEAIRESDTAVSLYRRLSESGARLLAGTLEDILAGRAEARPQDHSQATYAPKIERELGAVDWRRPGVEVDRLIRGLSGQGEAYAYFESAKRGRLRVRFFDSRAAECAGAEPGLAFTGKGGSLYVACGKGCVEVRELQVEGKRRVWGTDFANGYHISGGARFLGGGAGG